jgi:hypothetical protein
MIDQRLAPYLVTNSITLASSYDCTSTRDLATLYETNKNYHIIIVVVVVVVPLSTMGL